uniref:EF-hand domain-containing protein n=1 Tax=Alexandrium monilatum TaxID=311494 RepID=A0A7S4QBX5_9DINO
MLNAPAEPPEPAAEKPGEASCSCGGVARRRAELRAVLEEVLDQKLGEAGLDPQGQWERELRQQALFQRVLRGWSVDSFEAIHESFTAKKGSFSSTATSPTLSSRSGLLAYDEPAGCGSGAPGSAAAAPAARCSCGETKCRCGSSGAAPFKPELPLSRLTPRSTEGRRSGLVCPVSPGVTVHPSEGSGAVEAWGEGSLSPEPVMMRRDSTFSCGLSSVARTTRRSQRCLIKGTPDAAARARIVDGDASLASRCHSVCCRLVTGSYFDSVVCALICLNALSLGIQTDYVASSRTMVVPLGFRVVEGIFCGIFTLELVLRMFVYRLSFFTRAGWTWNVFDCVVVGLQLLEELLAALSSEGSGESQGEQSEGIIPNNLSFTRVLRILRLIRVIRIVRILRLIRELRTLVSSISNSLKSLGWTVLLLLLMIYTVSLYITQMVTDHLIGSASAESPHAEALRRYYGSLGASMLSLFESVTGGVDWDSLVYPLIMEISPLMAVLFVLFIAFAILAMMNVVTGVFVESVLLSAKADRDIYLMNSAREIFKSVDGGINSGILSWDDFQEKLATPQMQDFFKHIDVDVSEAKGLFRLLDTDGSGSISADEFLNGCIRLRGPAKALDAAVLIEEVKLVRRDVREWSRGPRGDGRVALQVAASEPRLRAAGGGPGQ